MGPTQLFSVGVLVQLLIFIPGPQVGGGAWAENPSSSFALNNTYGDSSVKVGESERRTSLVGKQPSNATRSKLWSPYSTVVSRLQPPTGLEDQQRVNQSGTTTTTSSSSGPIISNIRHYKSRKSFSRVKPSTTTPTSPQLIPSFRRKSVEDGESNGVEGEGSDRNWQGDEPIPPASLAKEENERGSPNSNVTGVSIYGKPRLKAPQTPGGKLLRGNFTKIDQIKSFLAQNKTRATKTNTTSKTRELLKNVLHQNSQTPLNISGVAKDEINTRRPSPGRSSSSSNRSRTSSSNKVNGRKRKSSRRKLSEVVSTASGAKSLNPVSLTNFSLAAAQTQYSEYQNPNDNEYYDIIETPEENPKEEDEAGVFVPGIYPTFYEASSEAGGEEDGLLIGAGPNPSDPYPSTPELEDNKEMDIVSKFLRIIEERTPENCTAGVNLTLGQGVVDRYAQDRFRLEAEVAVNRANMLTRLWKYAPHVMESEYLLHSSLLSIIEFDDDIFAAGNCYDGLEYKKYKLFCPFAHRLPEGDSILVKDLALEYNYLTNASEFFYGARKSAERIIGNFSQFLKGFHQYPFNDTAYTGVTSDDIILNVNYEDGKWSMPYFDCGGGNIWMMTYTVPFFGYRNSEYYFKGTSGIDIDLRRVDIDQCPIPENSTELNIFATSDKCKPRTTKCVPIPGLGFRRGSYICECRPGFYFPNISSPIKYFNGSLLEEEYENKFMRKSSRYDELDAFECLACPSGCDVCEDDRPCVVTLNWLMRTGILILQSAIILMLPLVGLFTWKYSEVKVVRAASPLLLRFIVLGAFFIYCTTLVMYPSPSVITCTLQVWLREIGFSLAYGALMLKTWRISVIFRVRSAKAVKITDMDLMKRLGIIVGIFTALLAIRTLVAPPVSIVSYTSDELKAWLCKSDWWDHSFTIMELSFLVWGIRLCIVVRKAPSEFNESKFISLAIYNEFLLSLFLNISMLFLQSPANPDLLYIIFFCHVQLTMTLLLCLIFGSKAYMVFRGHGKGGRADELQAPNATKFINKGQRGQGAQNSTGMNCRFNASISRGHDKTPSLKFPEDVQEEFRRLYSQLEELKERNMRLGNRHLVAKITAMQEAADLLSAGNSTGNGNGGHEEDAVASSSSRLAASLHSALTPSSLTCTLPPGSGSSSSGTTSNPRGKSMGILSEISEDENPKTPGPEGLGTCPPVCTPPEKTDLTRRSIPPQSLAVSSSSKAKVSESLALPTNNKRAEGERTPSSPCDSAVISPSENEAQVGDDELERDLELEEDEELQVTITSGMNPCSSDPLGANDMSRRRTSDCDNEGNPLDSTRKTTHSSKISGEEREIEGGSESEAQNQQGNSSSSLGGQGLAPADSQDPNSSSAGTSTTTKPGETSPSKMILDLNDKSRFTEEITV